MVNKVTLVGHLGKDPEVRRFDNGAVCNFSLATNESYKDKDGNRVDQTEWHNIAIWKPGLVDVAEKYLKKGSLLYAEGKLRTRSWDDQDGNKRYTTEVLIDGFKMLDKAGGSSDKNTPPPPNQDDRPSEAATESESNAGDDLPF